MRTYSRDIMNHAAEMRSRFSFGDRVKIVIIGANMHGASPGDTGTVVHIGDLGTVFLRLDSGGEVGILYGEDEIRKVG